MHIDTADPAPLRPQGCSHFKLRQLQRRVGQHFDLELAKSGMKTTQYSLLSQVLKLGPIRPVDLALAMTMDASTLTRNLRPLIQAGWVVSGAGADGRSRLIQATETGRAKRTEAQQHWLAAQLSLTQRLGAARVLALHTLIDDSLDLLAPSPAGDHDE